MITPTKMMTISEETQKALEHQLDLVLESSQKFLKLFETKFGPEFKSILTETDLGTLTMQEKMRFADDVEAELKKIYFCVNPELAMDALEEDLETDTTSTKEMVDFINKLVLNPEVPEVKKD